MQLHVQLLNYRYARSDLFANANYILLNMLSTPGGAYTTFHILCTKHH